MSKNNCEILSFDLEAPFGASYTKERSGAFWPTYVVPTPTMMTGLVAAAMGLERLDFRLFEQLEVSLEVLSFGQIFRDCRYIHKVTRYDLPLDRMWLHFSPHLNMDIYLKAVADFLATQPIEPVVSLAAIQAVAEKQKLNEPMAIKDLFQLFKYLKPYDKHIPDYLRI